MESKLLVSLTHFQPMFHFYTPLKTSENLRSKCLTHFQPIEVEHSLEMG